MRRVDRFASKLARSTHAAGGAIVWDNNLAAFAFILLMDRMIDVAVDRAGRKMYL